MTGDCAPFDPNDPFDLTADRMRKAMATAFQRIHNQAMALGLPPQAATVAIVSGLLTATAGCILAITREDRRGEICDAIVKEMPDAFARAETIFSSQETIQ